MNVIKFLILFACISQCSGMHSEVDGSLPSSQNINFEQMKELAYVALKDKKIKGIVCYAWHEEPKHRNNELPKKIANTLRECGVDVQIDVNNLNAGDSIQAYVQKISDPNYFVIFIITPLAAERCAINESDLEPSCQSPWIKREALRIADRLRVGNPIIPIVLESSDEYIKAHLFFTNFFNSYIKTRKPNHLPQEYLYISFHNDSQFYSNILDIINRRLLAKPITHNPIKIKRGYHDKLSTAEHIRDFFIDYVAPYVVPTFAVCAAIYFGINNFKLERA